MSPFKHRLWLLCFTVLSILYVTRCHQHGHAHDHGDAHDDHHGHTHEPPSFKYSRQANEQQAHAHSHGAGGHNHAHDDHHGHAHDHGHTHGQAEKPSSKYSPEVNQPPVHSHSHGHSDHAQDDAHVGHVPRGGVDTEARSTSGIWLWVKALASTGLVSAAPVIILLLIPLNNAHEQQELLKVLLSFASGGLLGDAFLHLIPHAISPHSHTGGSHEHSHAHSHSDEHGHDDSHNLRVGLWVLFGIVAFLAVEKFVRYVKGGHTHGHSHSHVDKPVKSEETTVSGKGKEDGDSDTKSDKEDKSTGKGKKVRKSSKKEETDKEGDVKEESDKKDAKKERTDQEDDAKEGSDKKSAKKEETDMDHQMSAECEKVKAGNHILTFSWIVFAVNVINSCVCSF